LRGNAVVGMGGVKAARRQQRRLAATAANDSGSAVGVEEMIAQLRAENARLKLDLGSAAKAALTASTSAVAVEASEEAEEVKRMQASEAKLALEYIDGANEAYLSDAYLMLFEDVYVGEGDVAQAAADFNSADANKTTEDAAAAAAATAATAAGPVTLMARPRPVVEKTTNPLPIVFVTSEVAPWSKTGGLADVCGSLPRELVARGHRVMVIAPRYLNNSPNDRLYDEAFDTNTTSKVFCFKDEQTVGFFHQVKDGVDFVFVDHPSYKREGGLYGDKFGVYGDNQFRYTLLSHAACEAPLVINFANGGTYGQDIVFIANDWHAGLVPVLVASKYRKFGTYNNARTITAIHNIMHQGIEPHTTFSNLGVPDDWYKTMEYQFPEHLRAHELDLGLVVNIMKGAILTSDRVLTVSQGYAEEIITEVGGKGLEELLAARRHRLDGVVNGIDTEEWNPAADKFCEAPFDVTDLAGKLECKRALQRELGFEVRDDVPLLGFIGRLDWQKGPDLIRDSIHELMSEDVQVVMLGSGLPELEQFMRWSESIYSEKFRGWVGFSVPMSHRITAGCDILLMPSRFEPCGLNQLYAMRYGTLPIAHATGGLIDTITRHNPFADPNPEIAVAAAMARDSESMSPEEQAAAELGPGTGWLFSPMETNSFMWAVKNATQLYRERPEMWRAMQIQAMSQDLSWTHASMRWEKVLEWAKIDPPHCK